MEGFIEIHSSYFTDLKDYVSKVNGEAKEYLRQRLHLLGITKDDLEDPRLVEKYQIGKHKSVGDIQIHEIYSAMGITLVEVLWDTNSAIIKTPTASPNYAPIQLRIQYIKQRPKQ